MSTQALQSSSQSPVRQILNIVALGAVITINALANLLPINNLTTGEISDSFASLVAPAGYVFSIWGLIYLLLIVFVVYQVQPAQRANPLLERLGYAFVWSCVFNFLWIFAWHYQQFALTQLFMLGLLVSLIVAYERLQIGRTAVSRSDKFMLWLPFSVYLGWITVATVANTTVFLLDLGITGGTFATGWAIVAILAATAIGLLVLLRRRDLPYGLVLVWALVGIAVSQWQATPAVVVTALLSAGILLVVGGLLRFSKLPLSQTAS